MCSPCPPILFTFVTTSPYTAFFTIAVVTFLFSFAGSDWSSFETSFPRVALSLCASFLFISSTLKMEAVCSSEILVNSFQTKRCHTPIVTSVRTSNQTQNVYFEVGTQILDIIEIYFSHFYRTTRRHIPEHSTLRNCRYKNLKINETQCICCEVLRNWICKCCSDEFRAPKSWWNLHSRVTATQLLFHVASEPCHVSCNYCFHDPGVKIFL
jgi:hypothetical protein